MSDMKIVVTRAPRIRKAIFAELEVGKYYLSKFGVECFKIGIKDSPSRMVDAPFTLPYTLDILGSVVPFASFDDMCRWVANGRKLEDLQGDCKDEWVTINNLPEGVFAVIMEYHAEKLIGLVVMKAATDAKALISIIDGARFVGDQYCSVMVSDMMVWPLGAGDTITIGG